MKIGRISERGKNGRQEINFYLDGAPREDYLLNIRFV